MTRRLYILIVLILSVVVESASAQFYTTGRGRTSTRWQQIDSADFKVVYPAGYFQRAAGVATLLDSISGDIGYGVGIIPQKVPIILRTENVLSNGYVVWAPKREELVMTAPMDTYALSWDKQLAVHEWRHVTQISALNHGITRFATWLMGQSGYSVGLFGLPRWVMEGDAVVTETQFAEYGRGLQPEFSVEYRAIMAEGRRPDSKHLDRWICGSYKNHYPDIYKFGYQTLSAAQTYLGADYIAGMYKYVGTWPITIIPTDLYLKKHYKTSYKKIATRAFAELDSLWAQYSDVDENFTQITPQNTKSYTTYSYPKAYDGGIVALKSDYDTPLRLVDMESGKQISEVGSVTSPMMVSGDKVYFTEYVPHPIFEQVNFSAIRSIDLKTKESKIYHKWGRNWNLIECRDGFASISIDELSRSFIRYFDENMEVTREYHFGEVMQTLHGIAYDKSTDLLCYIALNQDGMSIRALDKNNNITTLLKPSLVSISGLSAQGGKLYFSSIESGKNEIHSLDIFSGEQLRLTDSRFASQMVSPCGDSLLFTTYTVGGEMVASLKNDSLLNEKVEWSRLPQNKLNPERTKWSVPKVDTINIEVDSIPEKTEKYRPEFAVHSWAPVSFDGDYLMASRPMNMALGVTAFFQSSLSELTGYATYGWMYNSHLVKGRVEYKGLPMTISLGAEYGGGNQAIIGVPTFPMMGTVYPESWDTYFATDLSVSLPLNFSSGGYSRLLQPSFSVQYNNSVLFDYQDYMYKTGLAQYSASLWWSSTRYGAKRTIVPRLGYAVRADVTGSFRGDVGTIYSIFGRGYLPGVAKNHSVTLRASAQYQDLKTYNTSAKSLYLTGASEFGAAEYYGAAMVDYTMPVCYPDWGWDGVVYFSRISANLFGGYSLGSYLTGDIKNPTQRDSNYTYGVDLMVDFNLIRSYDQGVTFTFAMPRNSFYFGVGYSMGF